MVLTPLTRDIAVECINTFIEMSAQLKGDYWVCEHYLYDLPRKWELSYVARDNNQIVGFMIVSDKGPNHHLHRLVIGKERRKQGLGKIFMHRFLSDAQASNKKIVTLKVNKKNDSAILFYEELQFKRAGEDEESFLYELKL